MKLGIKKIHLFTRLQDPKLYTSIGWGIIGKEEYRSGVVSVIGKAIKNQVF